MRYGARRLQIYDGELRPVLLGFHCASFEFSARIMDEVDGMCRVYYTGRDDLTGMDGWWGLIQKILFLPLRK